MVFGFVKQSGGSIEVLKARKGGGATFRIYLPKADANALPSAYDDERPVLGGHETILCVEDDPDVRKP